MTNPDELKILTPVGMLTSVAAHTVYEKSRPDLLPGPTKRSTDAGSVSGSMFQPSPRYASSSRSGIWRSEMGDRLQDLAKVIGTKNAGPFGITFDVVFARAFKLTLVRKWAQGSVGERDTFDAQQYAPLLDIVVP